MAQDQHKEIADVEKKAYVEPELKKAQNLKDVTEGEPVLVTGGITT